MTAAGRSSSSPGRTAQGRRPLPGSSCPTRRAARVRQRRPHRRRTLSLPAEAPPCGPDGSCWPRSTPRPPGRELRLRDHLVGLDLSADDSALAGRRLHCEVDLLLLPAAEEVIAGWPCGCGRVGTTFPRKTIRRRFTAGQRNFLAVYRGIIDYCSGSTIAEIRRCCWRKDETHERATCLSPADPDMQAVPTALMRAARRAARSRARPVPASW